MLDPKDFDLALNKRRKHQSFEQDMTSSDSSFVGGFGLFFNCDKIHIT